MKNRMPIHRIIKSQGYGAVTLLAKELNKSKSNVSATISSERISIQGEIDFCNAVNKVFDKNYTRDELFRSGRVEHDLSVSPRSVEKNNEKALVVKEKVTRSVGSIEKERKGELLLALRKIVGVDKFKDFSEWQEVGRMENLINKIGKDEFYHRLKYVLSDNFKRKNSNKLSYLRKEIESFIHSPVFENSNIC